MRPALLNPLFSPVTSLKGVGPRLARLFARLVDRPEGARIVDLLWHLPAGLIERRQVPTIAAAPLEEIVTLRGRVGAHQPGRGRQSPTRIPLEDETGLVSLVFFHAKPDYLAMVLPEGTERIVSGRIEAYQGRPQMTHPDYILKPEEAGDLPARESVYPLTAGLTAKVVRRTVLAALERRPALPEWQDRAWLKRQGWPDWREALDRAHHPERQADLDPAHPARARLAYDELLANQLAIALMRAHTRTQKGRPLPGTGALVARAIDALPFELTGAQRNALEEISRDMEAPARMVRLLQGDVGSGKTVVAFLAALQAIESGAQAAIMAPTEILARQHHGTIIAFAEATGIRAAILTGREKGAERAAILEDLKSGDIALITGTHALFQSDVAFADLGLAVVDEQHRFGVHQRLSLGAKGRAADLLVMTATPIPRTLTLTVYGDMSVSRLDEKPRGRRPVATRTVPLTRLEEIVTRVRAAGETGAQIYWVCPLVEESEKVDAAAAEDRFAHLSSVLPFSVALVHGRMKAEEKDAVMTRFKAGEITLLVSTTVIEVGVDVPNASVMIIEHAERFGLAQLHQLRGRVGRGARESSCVLLYQAPLGETAKARLKVLRQTDDGFIIAEEDLRLRGTGDLLGTRQSGFPAFRLADPMAHGDLLEAAHDDAALTLARDGRLETARGQALRLLLYLFGRDEAVRYLKAG